MTSVTGYVLGADPGEIARLDAQGAFYAASSELLLRTAGLEPGMRVLDLGCGPGHVSQLVARLVGSDGEVVGVDQSEPLLALAEQRRIAAGLDNIRFVRGDARGFRDSRPFDAVVGRLILFHLPDAVEVVRHHSEGLAPGGLVVVLDFDLGRCRSEPPVPLVESAFAFVESAFRSAGANPTIGPRLASILQAAGLADVETLGVQAYIAPDDPRGPALLGGVVRTLASSGTGVELPAELELDTLGQRLGDALRAADSVLVPPTLSAAWGRRRS